MRLRSSRHVRQNAWCTASHIARTEHRTRCSDGRGKKHCALTFPVTGARLPRCKAQCSRARPRSLVVSVIDKSARCSGVCRIVDSIWNEMAIDGFGLYLLRAEHA